MVQFQSIHFFSWISSIFDGFFKSSRFFCVTLYINIHVTSVIPSPERNNESTIARKFYLTWGLMTETKEPTGVWHPVRWSQRYSWRTSLLGSGFFCCRVGGSCPFDRTQCLQIQASRDKEVLIPWIWRQWDLSKRRKPTKMELNSISSITSSGSDTGGQYQKL